MKDNYLTVTALTRYIKRKIDTDKHLQTIWLKGEISNFNHHNRGHMYMTIKDENSRVKAVMFAGKNRSLKFLPESGMKVLIRGNIGVYEPQGQYQLYIDAMEPDGIGALYLAYEQLKEKLQKQGYFNNEIKKEIPKFPQRIGVITSPTGAVVRDILTTIKRRYPIVEVIVIPVLVQGATAAESIQRAIQTADQSNMFDTIIVGRGGGSIEELWSFNEEIIADAIYHANTPIISAVGHETDTTISDYVADLRAPTPTSAAELAVPSRDELVQRIMSLNTSLHKEIERTVEIHKRNLHHMNTSYAFRYPVELVKQKEQELDLQLENLQRAFQLKYKEQISRFQTVFKRLEMQHPEKQMKDANQSLQQLQKRNTQLIEQIMESKQLTFQNLLDKLTLVNPLSIMKRGFAIPFNDKGNILKSIQDTKETDKIKLEMNDGSLYCEVLTKKENENGG